MASIPNFEEAYFEQKIKNEKPYNAFLTLKDDPIVFNKVRDVLTALLKHDVPVPDGCIKWTEIDNLEHELRTRGDNTLLSPVK